MCGACALWGGGGGRLHEETFSGRGLQWGLREGGGADGSEDKSMGLAMECSGEGGWDGMAGGELRRGGVQGR